MARDWVEIMSGSNNGVTSLDKGVPLCLGSYNTAMIYSLLPDSEATVNIARRHISAVPHGQLNSRTGIRDYIGIMIVEP